MAARAGRVDVSFDAPDVNATGTARLERRTLRMTANLSQTPLSVLRPVLPPDRPLDGQATGTVTATVPPQPRRPPAWAAASIPSARPDTTVSPDSDKPRPNVSASRVPCAVAERAPTMATAGRASMAGSPWIYSSGGGSARSNSRRG